MWRAAVRIHLHIVQSERLLVNDPAPTAMRPPKCISQYCNGVCHRLHLQPRKQFSKIRATVWNLEDRADVSPSVVFVTVALRRSHRQCKPYIVIIWPPPPSFHVKLQIFQRNISEQWLSGCSVWECLWWSLNLESAFLPDASHIYFISLMLRVLFLSFLFYFFYCYYF